MAFLAWIENTAFSTAVHESALVYPIILTLHSIGMGFLVGVSAMVDLRILGAARDVPLASLERFFPVMWAGFWVNLATGLVLLAIAATTHLTDPVMYFKLACVTLAVVIVWQLQHQVFRGRSTPETSPEAKRARILAVSSLVLWTLAITAGRLTAYTFFRFWNWK